MMAEPKPRRILTAAVFQGADGAVEVEIEETRDGYKISVAMRMADLGEANASTETLHFIRLEGRDFERVMTEVAAWKRAVEAAGDPRIFPNTAKIAAE